MTARAKVKLKKGKGMNGVETRWAGNLERDPEVLWWAFEPMNLRLGEGTHYRPDFVSIDMDGQVNADEIKATWSHGRAGMADHGRRAKIYAAAQAYPWIHFRIRHYSKRGGWQTIEVDRHADRLDITGEAS